MLTQIAHFERVCKEYPLDWLGKHKLRALDDVTLTIKVGEVVGVIGPNRAGKTTFAKLLLSLCRPTSGSVVRLGKPASDRSTLGQVGYVHENQAFPRYLTASQLLEYYGALSLLRQEQAKRKVGELLELVGLADRAHEPISRFSKGMVQRLGIAQALINDPKLLVFDEPSEGLDLMGRQVVRDIIRRQKELGNSVLFVSHVLPEIEHLVDRLIVLRAGRVVFDGALDELLQVPDGSVRSLESAVETLYRPSLATPA